MIKSVTALITLAPKCKLTTWLKILHDKKKHLELGNGISSNAEIDRMIAAFS